MQRTSSVARFALLAISLALAAHLVIDAQRSSQARAEMAPELERAPAPSDAALAPEAEVLALDALPVLPPGIDASFLGSSKTLNWSAVPGDPPTVVDPPAPHFLFSSKSLGAGLDPLLSVRDALDAKPSSAASATDAPEPEPVFLPSSKVRQQTGLSRPYLTPGTPSTPPRGP